jgi:NAD+ kinase
MPPSVLLVTKVPTAERLTADDLGRLIDAGACDRDSLAEAAERHHACLAAVRAALSGACVRELRLGDLAPGDGRGADLVVTVGGDGTVFTANTLATAAPFITVNSDPVGSVGHFTRCRAEGFAGLYAAWRAGSARIEDVPRLLVQTAGGSYRFLNDCLFTSRNPAAVTRYVLDCPAGRESQRSSGVWIATAAGSTGGIQSAGATPVPTDRAALLYRVREPFHGRGEARLLDACQRPPQWLHLTPAMAGCALYLDGPNITVPLRPGERVSFSDAGVPLRLVAG